MGETFQSHKVIDHIIPPAKGKEKPPKIEEEKEMWDTLDATVLQWIYATISHDFLHTILEPDTTTMEAWNRLCDIFQDNKHSRAVILEYDFTHTEMENFPNVLAYCQHLKSLSDQLKNVGSPVDNNRLVLQLFYKARSMLVLEEYGLNKAAQTTSSAMITRDSDNYHETTDQSSLHSNNNGGKRHQNHGNSSKNKNSDGGQGKGTSDGGGGGSGGEGKNGDGNNRNGGQQHHPPATASSWQQWMQWPWIQWPVTPYPFPTRQWARPNLNFQQ
ncbi:uncharacterized protein LOC110707620 [Chenopodium quinoa]|uniref:uncharacterized protein LOC110707620 n=1 Tax=Chenopodium quinoa TaxID=63459 RepID=UPI000B79AE1B|nr:uncharacterized protein LOC110707620 [Chenopodium quinoa]